MSATIPLFNLSRLTSVSSVTMKSDHEWPPPCVRTWPPLAAASFTSATSCSSVSGSQYRSGLNLSVRAQFSNVWLDLQSSAIVRPRGSAAILCRIDGSRSWETSRPASYNRRGPLPIFEWDRHDNAIVGAEVVGDVTIP